MLALYRLLGIRNVAWAWIGIAAVLACGQVSCADESDAPELPLAEKLVRSALQLELEGDNKYRNLTLATALQQDADLAAAHWQQGDILIDGAWKPAKDIVEGSLGDDRTEKYQRMRDLIGGDPKAEVELAEWCELHGPARSVLGCTGIGWQQIRPPIAAISARPLDS